MQLLKGSCVNAEAQAMCEECRMSLGDAVLATGPLPPDSISQDKKKRYSEVLSSHLARELAAELRNVGFKNVRPLPDGPTERAFQGGLGPKKVDVSYSDEQHGLMLAVSIKSICFSPFGKNLKNRFGDLLTEAITLHLRFPYSVICMLFAFPIASHEDITKLRPISTFSRAMKLFATVSGRKDYTDPGEKFENVTMMLFEPVTPSQPNGSFSLYDAKTTKLITVEEYIQTLRRIYNERNPHAPVGERDLEEE
jgi:hypothetical protein